MKIASQVLSQCMNLTALYVNFLIMILIDLVNALKFVKNLMIRVAQSVSVIQNIIWMRKVFVLGSVRKGSMLMRWSRIVFLMIVSSKKGSYVMSECINLGYCHLLLFWISLLEFLFCWKSLWEVLLLLLKQLQKLKSIPNLLSLK